MQRERLNVCPELGDEDRARLPVAAGLGELWATFEGVRSLAGLNFGELGVIAESSQKPTLSQLPLDISVLRERPFG